MSAVHYARFVDGPWNGQLHAIPQADDRVVVIQFDSSHLLCGEWEHKAIGKKYVYKRTNKGTETHHIYILLVALPITWADLRRL